MIISVGNSRLSTNWEKEEISFDDLALKVSMPKITKETFSQFMSLPKSEQDNLKDVGGFVGGELNSPRRKRDNVKSRSLLTLDADNINGSIGLEEIVGKLNALSCQYVVYSTRKHTNDEPRIRILIPFNVEIPSEMYEPAVRKMCEYLGIEQFDPTTVEAHRLMFWPSVSTDMLEDFYYRSNLKGQPLFVGDLLNQYENWTDRKEWPLFQNEILKDHNGPTQQDPLEKGGVIGAFCRTFSITDAIENFLSEIYERVEDNRYTYREGSTAGGMIIWDNDKFSYSFHSTDPTCGILCNAFDLVRIHKFGNTDTSVDKMIEFATGIPEVERLIQKEAIETLAETVAKYEEDKDKEEDLIDFSKKLTRDKKGAVHKTIANIITILEGDPNLKGKYYYDLFSDHMMVTEDLPWQTKRPVPRMWNDTDDAGIRWYLETNYGITGKEKIFDATNIAFSDNATHPIKEYIEETEWDGTKRIDTLLIDYYGAEDNVYTRQATRKTLIAAVARIYEPGIKFDEMLILIGSQGIGKSTFFNRLGIKWFSDSLTEFSGKDAYEALQGRWILEVGELAGFNKYEVRQIKQFLTKQEDDYRAAYARRKETHPRQCIICGTTNESTFLKDTTGNRRFWPIPLEIGEPTKNIFNDFNDEEIAQVWAEAYQGYLKGEFLDLEGEEAKELAEIQQRLRTEIDPRETQIIEFIKRPIPGDWYKQSIESHKMHWNNPGMADEDDLIQRDKICAMEIHLELFDRPLSEFDRFKSREINAILDMIPGLKKLGSKRFGNYGVIKGAYEVTPDFYEKN